MAKQETGSSGDSTFDPLARSFDLGPALRGLLFVLLLSPLLVYSYVGFHARYVADDFCTAGTLVSRGFLGSQFYWYTGWSGRFSFTAVVNLVELAGPEAAQFLPAAVALFWIVAVGWVLKKVLEIVGRIGSWEPYLLAIAGLDVAYVVAPATFQSFYWQTGLVTYLLPTILVLGQAGWALRRLGSDRKPQSLLQLGLFGLLAFVVGGFSEVLLAVQAAMYLALVMGTFAFDRDGGGRAIRPAVAVGLGGTLVAAAVVVLAPGNQARFGFMPGLAGLGELLLALPRYAVAFAAKSILRAPVAMLAAMVLAAGIAFGAALGEARLPPSRGRFLRLAAVGVGLAGVSILVSIVPPAVATAAYPVDRALLPATVFLTAGVMALGWLLGETLLPGGIRKGAGPRTRAVSWTLRLLGAMGIAATCLMTSARLLPDVQDYARAYDRREMLVRESLETSVSSPVVRPLPHIGDLAELDEDPANWVNGCFALYHGFDTVVAR